MDGWIAKRNCLYQYTIIVVYFPFACTGYMLNKEATRIGHYTKGTDRPLPPRCVTKERLAAADSDMGVVGSSGVLHGVILYIISIK